MDYTYGFIVFCFVSIISLVLKHLNGLHVSTYTLYGCLTNTGAMIAPAN